MVWGNPPPPMALPRRTSTSSVSSSGSSRVSSPSLTPLDSSAALILVHDEETQSPFHLDSDDDNEDEDSVPQFDVHRTSTPPLSPSLVFLYLLVPYLKLGAMFLPHTETPLNYGLPSLFVFALLAAFARQLLYMLSRYTRSAELEDVVLDLLARGRGKERRRSTIRIIARAGIGGLRALLATVYLRESVHLLLPLLLNGTSLTLRLGLTSIFILVVAPISFAQSLGSKRIVYTTWLTLATYIIWLTCITYAYIHHMPLENAGWLRTGTFWQGPVTIAFAFTSSSTLSLYTSLRGSHQPVTTAKPSKFRSFELLSVLSVILALLLTLPLVIFSADPSVPETSTAPRYSVLSIIPVLNATTLLLSIPSLIVTVPSLPVTDRLRCSTSFPISKILLLVFVTILALVPSRISAILSDILLLCALTSTYFLPAVLHIIAHFFERPLTILTPRNAQSREGRSGPDELLLRKERALQKKQFRKRIVWDLGVWLLLLGGGAGFVAAIGRVLGTW
ncbi:hypothetical protein H2248_007665 [Termitomyces sp. 'cryptogamus']|nr:hypothetical protein H2248_007665 [Termitomyces sp. 'cryptogamus']